MADILAHRPTALGPPPAVLVVAGVARMLRPVDLSGDPGGHTALALCDGA